MLVTVRLFASLKEQLGATFSVEVPDAPPGSATAQDLREALGKAHPAFARYGSRLLVAVNEAYARDTDPVRPTDSVALIPPVAGG